MNESVTAPLKEVDTKTRKKLWDSLLAVCEKEKEIMFNKKRSKILSLLQQNMQHSLQISGSVALNKSKIEIINKQEKNNKDVKIGLYKTFTERNIKDRHKLRKLEKHRKHKKLTEIKGNLYYKENPNQPKLVVLHEHKKKINQSSNDNIPEERNKLHPNKNKREQIYKEEKLLEKVRIDKNFNDKLYPRNEKEAVERHISCNGESLKETKKKRQDKYIVYKNTSKNLESKLRKKRQRFLHKQFMKDKSTSHGMTELINKIKSLPISVDENQLIFMAPSHISKLLEYSCNSKKLNLRNIVCGNQDIYEKRSEPKIPYKVLDESSENILENIHTSSKDSRDFEKLKKIKHQKCNKILSKKSYNNVPDLQNIVSEEKKKHRKKRSKYTVADKKNSFIDPSVEKDPTIPADQRVRRKGEILRKEKNNTLEHKNLEMFGSSLSSQNKKLSTIYSEGFASRCREDVSRLSNNVLCKNDMITSYFQHLSRDENNTDKTKELRKRRLQCKRKTINVAKPLISEDGKRLTFQLVKADATIKHPKMLRKNVKNIERLSSKERSNTIQRDHLMLFYANRESTNTSKDSLNIAISRDTEISSNGSSNNVLNVVIKQTKNSLTNNLTSTTEKQSSLQCDEEKTRDSTTNSEKLGAPGSDSGERNLIEEILLREAGCQTEVFSSNCKIQHDSCEIMNLKSQALDYNNTVNETNTEMPNNNYQSFHQNEINNSPNVKKTNHFENGTSIYGNFEKNLEHSVMINPVTDSLSDCTNKNNVPGIDSDANKLKKKESLSLQLNENDTLSHDFSKKTANIINGSLFGPTVKRNDKCASEKYITSLHIPKDKMTSFKPSYHGQPRQCLEIENEKKCNHNIKSSPITAESDRLGSKLREIGLSSKTSFIKIIEPNIKIIQSDEKKLSSVTQKYLDLSFESVNKYENTENDHVNKNHIKTEDSNQTGKKAHKNNYIPISKQNTSKASGNKSNLFPNCKRLSPIHTLRNKMPIEKYPIGDHIIYDSNKYIIGDNITNLKPNVDQIKKSYNREKFLVVLPDQSEVSTVTNSTQVKHFNMPSVKAKMFAVTEIGVQTDKIDEVLTDKHEHFDGGAEPSFQLENTKHFNPHIDEIKSLPCDKTKTINIPQKKCSFIQVIKDDFENFDDCDTIEFNRKVDKNVKPKNIYLETIGNTKSSKTKTHNFSSLYNDKHQNQFEVVKKIDAIYDFLQYLDKTMKDNTFSKKNVNCNSSFNLGKFNSTLRCLCSNCIEILNKIETNQLANNHQYESKGLPKIDKKSQFLNVIEEQRNNDSSCVKYGSTNKLETQGHNQHSSHFDSIPEPFFVVIPSDEKLITNAQNTSIIENGNTIGLGVCDWAINSEDQIHNKLMERNIGQSAAKENTTKNRKQEDGEQSRGYINMENQTHELVNPKSSTLQECQKPNKPIINKILNNKASKFLQNNLNSTSEINSVSNTIHNFMLSEEQPSTLPEYNVKDFSSNECEESSYKNIACSNSVSSEYCPASEFKDKKSFKLYSSDELLYRYLLDNEAQQFENNFKPKETKETIYNTNFISDTSIHKNYETHEYNITCNDDVNDCDVDSAKIKTPTEYQAQKPDHFLNYQLNRLADSILSDCARDISSANISIKENRFDVDKECCNNFKGSVLRNRLHSRIKFIDPTTVKNDIIKTNPGMSMKQDANTENCCDDVIISRECFKKSRNTTVSNIEKRTRNLVNANILHKPYHKCDYRTSKVPCKANHNNISYGSTFIRCSSEFEALNNKTSAKREINNSKNSEEIKYSPKMLNNNIKEDSPILASDETLVKRNSEVNADLKQYAAVRSKSPWTEYSWVNLKTNKSKESLNEDVEGEMSTDTVVKNEHNCVSSFLRKTNSELSFCDPFSQYNESVVFVNKQFPFSENQIISSNNCTALNETIQSNTNALMQNSVECKVANNSVGNESGLLGTSGWISLSSCDLQSKVKIVEDKHVPDTENKVRLQMDIKMNDVMHVEVFCKPP